MADRPTEARAYGAHNTAPPLSKLPAHAGVSRGMVLWTQPAVLTYGADQALPIIDKITKDRGVVSVQLYFHFHNREVNASQN